jgi:hypothetical protein
MTNQGAEFIKSKRSSGLGDDEIRSKLTAAGWQETEIDTAFASVDDDTPPPPSQQPSSSETFQSQATVGSQPQPVAVVQQLSTRGVEYGIMFFSLAFGAVSLGGLLHNLIDVSVNPISGYASSYVGEVLAVQGIIALVTIPIFLFMFLRLRKAERENPALHQDSSRRSFVQKTLLIAFVWGIWAFAYNAYQLVTMTNAYNSYDGGNFDQGAFIVSRILHMLITLAIAGGIFAYFWRDEHKKNPV